LNDKTVKQDLVIDGIHDGDGREAKKNSKKKRTEGVDTECRSLDAGPRQLNRYPTMSNNTTHSLNYLETQ
jgi:hypothetical protein